MEAIECKRETKKEIMAVHDAMDVLAGKWRISIISSICYYNERRFSDILVDVSGISNRMLSKELKDLETNRLIKRTVLETQPITVKYQLTDYGKTLKSIIESLSDWGMEHRRVIVGEQPS